jgi:molybdopterin molybdotransferase
MIELERALAISGNYLIRTGTVLIPLKDALGRVLAENINADQDVPPFSRATMDGYACRQEDLPGPLAVLESIPAGKTPGLKPGKGQCSKIMTGGMVPDGANCVIMQEYAEETGDGSILFKRTETDRNIHPRGQDLKAGELLLPAGTIITPGHLGNISSTGMVQVKVARQLTIGILATGSELVDPGQMPHGAQIRNSNTHQVAAQIRRAGHLPRSLGIVEDRSDLLAERISESLEQLDLLIVTGGASVGELDLVPGVFEDLGLSLEFQQVAIQPGKPVTFAHRGGDVCFGLSGNPVSSFVQFEVLVRPYLEACTSAIAVKNRVLLPLQKGFERRRADRQFFLPVCFTDGGGCEPLDYHGSGHLHALAGAAGFAEIPAGQKVINEGDKVHVRLLQ